MTIWDPSKDKNKDIHIQYDARSNIQCKCPPLEKHHEPQSEFITSRNEDRQFDREFDFDR